MLSAVSSLKGFEIHARDGSLGTVSDVLFDEAGASATSSSPPRTGGSASTC